MDCLSYVLGSKYIVPFQVQALATRYPLGVYILSVCLSKEEDRCMYVCMYAHTICIHLSLLVVSGKSNWLDVKNLAENTKSLYIILNKLKAFALVNAK